MATAKIQPQEMNMCGLGFGSLVSEILKGLCPTILPQQKNIQAQEMRIWTLRICFREVSETCVPLSGRNRPTKNLATGNENLGLGLANLF